MEFNQIHGAPRTLWNELRAQMLALVQSVFCILRAQTEGSVIETHFVRNVRGLAREGAILFGQRPNGNVDARGIIEGHFVICHVRPQVSVLAEFAPRVCEDVCVFFP